jgi:hypothetical protein
LVCVFHVGAAAPTVGNIALPVAAPARPTRAASTLLALPPSCAGLPCSHGGEREKQTDRARWPLGGMSTFGQFERARASRILLEYFLSGTAPFYSFRNQTSMKAGWIGSIPVRSSTQRIISQSTKALFSCQNFWQNAIVAFSLLFSN